MAWKKWSSTCLVTSLLSVFVGQAASMKRSVKQVFESIKGAIWPDGRHIKLTRRADLLSQTKARLNDVNADSRASLVHDLNQLAGLAEQFRDNRPKNGKDVMELADVLDQEGLFCVRKQSRRNDYF